MLLIDRTRQCAEIIWNGDIGNVTEVHAGSDRPMWPQGLTEIPKEDPIPSTLDWDLWLGIAEKRPFTAGGKTEPDRNGGFFITEPRVVDRILRHRENERCQAKDPFEPRAPPSADTRSRQ